MRQFKPNIWALAAAGQAGLGLNMTINGSEFSKNYAAHRDIAPIQTWGAVFIVLGGAALISRFGPIDHARRHAQFIVARAIAVLLATATFAWSACFVPLVIDGGWPALQGVWAWFFVALAPLMDLNEKVRKGELGGIP